MQTTTYHMDFPFTGLVATQTKTHGTTTLSSVTNTYSGDTGCSTVTPTGPIYVAFLCKSVTTSNDLDGTAMPTVESDYSSYDAYGNAGTVAVKTTPPGGSTPDAVKTTTNTFINIVDPTHWLLGADRSGCDVSVHGRPGHHAQIRPIPTTARNGLITSETVGTAGSPM